jgi:putative oxidoreductase
MGATLRLHGYRDVAHLALRLALGAVFLYHGVQKLGTWSTPPPVMPAALFKVLAVVEPIAGLALILGLFTQWAALAIGIIAVGAIYTKIAVWHVPFIAATGTGWELDLALLGGAIALFIEGGGCMAMECMLGMHKHHE